MKNILIVGCSYPPELPHFTRGLAQVGGRVFGVDMQPESQLPAMTRAALSGYLQVDSLFDEHAALDAVRRWAGSRQFDHIESVWEGTVLLAARLREAFGVPGLRYEQVVRFRDKDKMKQAVVDAGIRTARHERANSARGCFAAAEKVGYPICLKPVAGAGSADTFRVESSSELESTLGKVGHIPEWNIEEFIDGDEFTFDTISIDGNVAYESISWYRPRPLIGRSVEWISPQTVTLRDIDQPRFDGGRALGRDVLKALGQQTGFAHMEWFRKSDGEAVFGEIAARPPGAHTVDTMNFVSDIDLFVAWAEAVVHGTWSLEFERLYNCAIIFKRAQGHGYIRRIEGLDRIMDSFGEHIPAIELLPVGAHRRDWVKTLLSDGFVFVRHPDLETTAELADRVGVELQMYASR
jgi:biotin carboxylase